MNQSRKRVAACVLPALFGLACLPAAATADGPAPADTQAWRLVAPFFSPPEQLAGDLGSYRSPLLFADGRPVRDAADWPARRAEIRAAWFERIGAWPPLLEQPGIEVLESEARDGYTEHRVQVRVTTDERREGYLLVPHGAGPFPAVLIVSDLPPAVSIGRGADRWADPRYAEYDFGRQLARRGFATMSLPPPRQALPGVQPLSLMAYTAANCAEALAGRPEIDPARIGIFGHSFGAKWALFAACLHERFAAAAWSDGGVVFDERRGNVNYWERWYLGAEPDRQREPGMVTDANPRTGAYQKLVEAGHDLHELHALMAPRPFLVSGGAEDPPERWRALNHTVAVNKLLGAANRVGMTNRPGHAPTAESNAQVFAFFEHFLRPVAGARPD